MTFYSSIMYVRDAHHSQCVPRDTSHCVKVIAGCGWYIYLLFIELPYVLATTTTPMILLLCILLKTRSLYVYICTTSHVALFQINRCMYCMFLVFVYLAFKLNYALCARDYTHMIYSVHCIENKVDIV
jgi:hypothetical protein